MRGAQAAAALLVLIAQAAASNAQQDAPKPPGPPPALVVTAPVEMGLVKPGVSLVGSVQARAESLVAAEVAGLARQVEARRGRVVRQGDVLVVLRDAELDEELESARAEARLAEAELEKARADRARAEDLVRKQVAPQEALDSARRDAQVWEQRVAKAHAAVRLLEDRVSRQTVRAPFDGVVVEEHTEVGEWVPKGGPVARVADLAAVLVRVPVPEQYIVEVAEGQVVPVRLDALGGTEFQGSIRAVIPAGDPQARTFPVEVEVQNPQRLLRAGMTARVVLQLGESRRELLVPTDALVPRGMRTLVYAVVDGAAVEVPVEVVGYQGDRAAVQGALPPDAPVIVRGNERVRPGQPVRVVSALP
ncbi:MAG: efflux RND transporter periplasmic adaptor subunit [Deferrisomatales bacterium]|nr:efflux RND transporter periplasmic adaptor subunit [Deferrisomatales bacterium]